MPHPGKRGDDDYHQFRVEAFLKFKPKSTQNTVLVLALFALLKREL